MWMRDAKLDAHTQRYKKKQKRASRRALENPLYALRKLMRGNAH
jgi:hypothetical protein